MRIFSKNKSDSNNKGNVRSFSVGNVEKTTYKKQAIIEDDNDFLKPPPSMNAAISEKKRSSSLTNMMRILSVNTPNNESPKSNNSSDKTSPIGFHKAIDLENHSIAPELVPIVTLLSAQAHRRYHVGVFLLYNDLNNDGLPGSRKWQEQYAVLIGNQLALWNSSDLDETNMKLNQNTKTQQELAHDLFNVASKPKYLNFIDAKFKILDGKDNTIVLSTTMKNRYFMKFSDKKSFNLWRSALRLCNFEYSSLQEAYTGAFLSSKGAKLSDIKVILADSKFNYEDWVSVRFGAGMPWKRCYAVVTPAKQSSKKKKKNNGSSYGEVVFYENEKKISNKKYAMATVTSANSIFAIYPSSPLLIDNSTMLKIEGEIEFININNDSKSKKSSKLETTSKQGDIFIMPEKHNGVPGYDTIIRFLVPMLNSFHLYGRPDRLISSRDATNSLLFGLPTLPEIHYLQVADLLPLAERSDSRNWGDKIWKDHIKELLAGKIRKGYSGCGSASGYSGAVISGSITTNELFGGSPRMQPIARYLSGSESPSKPTNAQERLTSNPIQNNFSQEAKKVDINNVSGTSKMKINTKNINAPEIKQEYKTPVNEVPNMNIPSFSNKGSHEKEVKKPISSPYHEYKKSSSVEQKKSSPPPKPKAVKPVDIGFISGANANVFASSVPYTTKQPDVEKLKSSNKNKWDSVSSNTSIIDSYANSNTHNTNFAMPTSGLGIVSSSHTTPKKTELKQEQNSADDDDYVVNTTDDPLADFYKLSRTLSNFNSLPKLASNQRESTENVTSKKAKAVEQEPKFLQPEMRDASTGQIFYDAPSGVPKQTNLKKSPQLHNMATFTKEEPKPKKAEHHLYQNPTISNANKSIKVPQENANPYYKQQQGDLYSKKNVNSVPQMRIKSPTGINQYPPNGGYSPVQQNFQHNNGGYSPVQQNFQHSNGGYSPVHQNFQHNNGVYPPVHPNFHPNNNGTPPAQQHFQQNGYQHGNYSQMNNNRNRQASPTVPQQQYVMPSGIPVKKKVPVSQQYKNANNGGYSQFMPN